MCSSGLVLSVVCLEPTGLLPENRFTMLRGPANCNATHTPMYAGARTHRTGRNTPMSMAEHRTRSVATISRLSFTSLETRSHNALTCSFYSFGSVGLADTKESKSILTFSFSFSMSRVSYDVEYGVQRLVGDTNLRLMVHRHNLAYGT